MKKPFSMVLVTTLASSLLLAPAVLAESQVKDSIVESDIELEQQTFFEIEGVIQKITEETSGNYFATVDGGDNPFGFYFNDNTKVFDNTGRQVTLKDGMKFTAYVDTSKPMIMIYPPRYSPDVIIVQTDEPGTLQLDRFDKNLLNKKQNLIIGIGKDTVITNLSGSTLSQEAIVEKDVLIFYDIVLESYPMQTGPSKIIVLEYDKQEDVTNIQKAYNIAETDFYEVNGVKMVPLRLIAEQLGYTVSSTGKGAIVSKGALSFTITRANKAYGYNKALRHFEEAPAILEKNKTYVPFTFINDLVGNEE